MLKDLTSRRILELLGEQFPAPPGSLIVDGLPEQDLSVLGYGSLTEGGLADAAYVVGPMSGMRRLADRLAALDEARHLLKRGGVVAALAVSKFAMMIDPTLAGKVTHAHSPDELASELARAGYAAVELYAVEGPYWMRDECDMATLRQMQQERSVMGISLHMLAFGRKV